MFQSNPTIEIKAESAEADPTTQPAIGKEYPSKAAATTTRGSTKDAGRVHIGAGMMRFDTTAPRKGTKDTGRVHIGAGMMRF